ncbi:hypothetical protein [Streptomyces albipurpureus]|uniref:Uncharacterized protein n=1 Tax=Streptomyces albipurpureus TaxID=2897419 RepID=A0ABT0UTU5_9ACTN|nr:hypothetical protein [Streptomyces sp. CWNU-1]MCM2391030.1 hypothetical protein [Streptomyces sp. CWNU-1]
MENLVATDSTGTTRRVGRGLPEITDRAALLGGRAEAGFVSTALGEGVWRLLVLLPVDGRSSKHQGQR